MASRTQHLWSPLREGDLVDIVAPGFASTIEELEGALNFLKDWGLVPRLPHNIYGRDVLCANNDEIRFGHLKNALLAEDSRAVWCVRGGYGSLRLVPNLIKLRRPSFRPKLFVGLSDITTLHLFLNNNWGWPTVHGPLLDRLGKGATKRPYLREMKQFAFGEIDEIVFKKLKPLNQAARKRVAIRGGVTGGNLITLQSSIGTKVEWDTRGKILFFEDIGERGYRVDRVLAHFAQAGFFDQAKAVIFGDFTGGFETDGRNLVKPVLERFASEMKLPVLSGLRSGHDLVQRPLPFETTSVLRLGDRPELVCPTGADT